MTTLWEVADKLTAVREHFHDIMSQVEDRFTAIGVYPATIPIYQVGDRVAFSAMHHQGKRARSPVAYLHFNDGHLSFSQVPRPYRPPVAPKCPRCKATCPSCIERYKAARKRWDRYEAEAAKPIDVLEIDDGTIMSAVVKALPDMKKRLEDDAKVSPEELQEAAAVAREWLDSLAKVKRV